MEKYFDDGLDLESLVFQALGAASVSWEHIEDAGIFDSTRCKEIGEELIIRIKALQAGPNLGHATTRELLDEITARIEVDGANGGGGLYYTPVGGKP